MIRVNDIVKNKNGDIFKITDIECKYPENREKPTIVYISGLIYPLYNKNIWRCFIEDIVDEYPTEQELLEQCKKYIDTTKEYVHCAICGELHEKDETEKHNDKYYCSACAEGFYDYCDFCCEKHLKTDLIDIGEVDVYEGCVEITEQHICKECFNKHHKKDIFWCDYHKMYELDYNHDECPFVDGKCFIGREELARKERLELLEKIGIKE